MTNQGPKTWSTSGIDLLLEPAHVGVPGLRARVEEGLREAIRSGRLARGTRLPPTRTPAREPPPMRWRFDLRPGRPDASSFPRAAWLRALRKALAEAPDDALGYGSER